MRKKIFYISYFDDKNERNVAPSAVTKTKYIAHVLAKMNYEVEIVSLAYVNDKSNADELRPLFDNVNYRLFGGKYVKNKIFKFFLKKIFNLRIKKYFKKNINKFDKVVVYHSLSNMNLVKYLKTKLRAFIIYEIEEIYGEVLKNNKIVKNEISVFSLADSYIFPTELMDETINTSFKPSAICYGTYKIENEVSNKFNDGKIHIVYAGTFSKEKGSIANVLRLQQYLDSTYHIHVLGFGTKEEVNFVVNSINETRDFCGAKITYEGMKVGNEYVSFIQKCHIGLSIQSTKGAFNNSSFPSKVLSYIANNLIVLTVKIPVLVRSKINEFLYYFEEDNIENIVKVIKNIPSNEIFNYKELLNELEVDFIKNLKRIIDNETA